MIDKKPKLSFKPYHGIAYKKYSIYRKRSNGVIKFMGNMMAPNDELALAKARENFEATIEHSSTLFVLPRD